MNKQPSALPKEVLDMIEYFIISRRSGNITLNIKDGFVLRAVKEEAVQINKNA